MKQFNKKFIIMLMSIIVTVTSLHYNYELIYANQVPQEEQPSLWALEDIQMLQHVYQFIDPSMFRDYKSEATKEQLYTIGVNLYEKLSNTVITIESKNANYSESIQKANKINLFITNMEDTNLLEPITRNDCISMLYKIISLLESTYEDFKIDSNLTFDDASTIPSESTEAVQYFVFNKLIKGSNNKLHLFNPCSKEQLLSLVTRTFEYYVQKNDTAAKGAFWKVSGGKSTVYLLGSIHIADSSIYPMNNDIQNAFDESDILAIEANILEDKEGIAYMQQLMFYTDGTTIEKVLSKETYDLYVAKMESYGVNKAKYDLFKPWGAALAIQNTETAKDNIVGILGVDNFYMIQAIYKKPIVEIEGIKFQADLFNSFSPELQETFLKSVLSPQVSDDNKEAVSTTESIKKMLEAWKAGDVKSLEKMLAFDEASNDEFSKKFWIDRNNHMFDTILKYVNDESNKTYFVIVGAGHMVSNTGIVNQLQEKGYTVTQIK